MPESGNNEQNTRIAESIATAVLDKVLTRHPDLKSGTSAGERLLQWIPLVVAVATAFWTLAIQSQQVRENTNDINRLELRDESDRDVLTQINSRLASIETTLEIVTGARGERRDYARPAE